jgi:sialic acid synthase SpsE
VDLLVELDVCAFKIASCDLTNLPLIEYAARHGRPLYISTGMGDELEARAAADTARAAGCPRVVLLQCTTNYPTAYPDVQLRAMRALAAATGCEVGFSDHSVGNYCCYAAAALGAVVIEKHFCLDKAASGPDIPGSCSPYELAELAAGIRAIEQALGSPEKAPRASERDIAAIARRSIFYVRDLPAGHVLQPADLAFLRPACGMSPARSGELLGRTLSRAVHAGDPAGLDHLG